MRLFNLCLVLIIALCSTSYAHTAVEKCRYYDQQIKTKKMERNLTPDINNRANINRQILELLTKKLRCILNDPVFGG